MKKGFEKRFNKGDIVYWHHQRGYKHKVQFGMVDEQFSDVVCIDMLEMYERRLVNGVPINKFPKQTKFKKLPKGWNYDTKLFNITYEPLKPEFECFRNMNIKDPNNIKEAYDKGFLVKSDTIYGGEIDVEITNSGYRLIKKYPIWYMSGDKKILHTSIRPDKVYSSYEEAQKEVDEINAEFERQSNLSDYDWSVEQIDKQLKRYKKITGYTDNYIQACRKWLLSLKNVEDLETRVYDGEIQWKYLQKNKWRNIEHSDIRSI